MNSKTRIDDIPVSQIKMGDRVRVVSADAVEVIRQSYHDLEGFTTPIHVRKLRGGSYELVDGAHRLTVARDLGLKTIQAKVWELSKAQAEFFETDANLAVSHLTPVAMARSLAARQEAYIKLHPETAAGSAGAYAKHGLQTTISSFAEFTGAVMGYSSRELQRMIRAGKTLTAAEAEALEASPLRVTKNDLTELAKISEPEERSRVVRLLAQGEVKNAKAARKTYKSEIGQGPAPRNATDQEWSRLLDAWNRGSKAARRIFLEQCGEEVQALLDEMGASDD